MSGLEIYQNILTPDQCNELIKLYNNDDRKESGKILSPEGLREDPKIKTSTDLNFCLKLMVSFCLKDLIN